MLARSLDSQRNHSRYIAYICALVHYLHSGKSEQIKGCIRLMLPVYGVVVGQLQDRNPTYVFEPPASAFIISICDMLVSSNKKEYEQQYPIDVPLPGKLADVNRGQASCLTSLGLIYNLFFVPRSHVAQQLLKDYEYVEMVSLHHSGYRNLRQKVVSLEHLNCAAFFNTVVHKGGYPPALIDASSEETGNEAACHIRLFASGMPKSEWASKPLRDAIGMIDENFYKPTNI